MIAVRFIGRCSFVSHRHRDDVDDDADENTECQNDGSASDDETMLPSVITGSHYRPNRRYELKRDARLSSLRRGWCQPVFFSSFHFLPSERPSRRAILHYEGSDFQCSHSDSQMPSLLRYQVGHMIPVVSLLQVRPECITKWLAVTTREAMFSHMSSDATVAEMPQVQ